MQERLRIVTQSEFGFSLTLVCAVCLTGACCGARVERNSASVERPPSVSVCDVIKDPTAYRGRMVAVTGVYWYGLRQACAEPLVTAGHTWPSALEFVDSSEAGQTGEPVSFQTDLRSWDDLNKTVIREAKAGRRGAIWVKITGKLLAPEKYIEDGRLVTLGYGHLGVFPAELVVESVSDIEVRPVPVYDYAELLRNPVE